MRLNKIVKGFVIALPVLTLMACSSSSSVDEQASETNQSAQTETSNSSNTGSNAQVGAATQQQSPQEVYREELAAVQNDQVIYFEFDRSSLQSEFYATLDKHAAFLRKNSSQRVTVEGHCDSRGTPEYNIALGERRAKAIETYLLNAGVRSSQISVVSYGEEKPAVRGSSESAFVKNRRGVLAYR
jgi:peptidoglycan-associated lipoprotein